MRNGKAITHEASGAPARKSPTPAHKQGGAKATTAETEVQTAISAETAIPVWIRGDCKGTTLDLTAVLEQMRWKRQRVHGNTVNLTQLKQVKPRSWPERYKQKQESAPSASLGAPVSQETEQQEEPMETDFTPHATT